MSRATQRIQSLIWPLIFGGMLLGSLGFSLQREHVGFGWTLIVVSACAVLAGIVLVWVRSRLPDPPPEPPQRLPTETLP